MSTLVTHSGSFHQDELFAIATLMLVFDDISVKRSREEKDIAEADFVVDVGGVFDPIKNRFDHH
jgi:uncharacterized UPF0160 family protein